MPRDNEPRYFGEKYKKVSRRREGKPEEDDPPRIVEETNSSAGAGDMRSTHVESRKCKVHRTKIEGINYTCIKCGSVFCLTCIANVLLPERKCMVCETSLEISDEFRLIIEKFTRQADTGMLALNGKVTLISPEIWRRFEELELEEDVLDEVIDRLKYVPPEDRLKYLNAIFKDEEKRDDPL